MLVLRSAGDLELQLGRGLLYACDIAGRDGAIERRMPREVPAELVLCTAPLQFGEPAAREFGGCWWEGHLAMSAGGTKGPLAMEAEHVE